MFVVGVTMICFAKEPFVYDKISNENCYESRKECMMPEHSARAIHYNKKRKTNENSNSNTNHQNKPNMSKNPTNYYFSKLRTRINVSKFDFNTL